MSEFKGTKGRDLNYNFLTSILSYNPDDGVFKWKKSIGQRVKVGETAGWIDKSTGYVSIKINNVNYKAHVLAWFYIHKKMPKYVDHINHVKSDNRLINLRDVSHEENHKNKSLSSNNTSGVCGVYFRKTDNKWTAQIKVNGKSKYLGIYTNKEDAISARIEANKKYGNPQTGPKTTD